MRRAERISVSAHQVSQEELAEFWDTHSLADYWEQTEHAEFEIAVQARSRKSEA